MGIEHNIIHDSKLQNYGISQWSWEKQLGIQPSHRDSNMLAVTKIHCGFLIRSKIIEMPACQPFEANMLTIYTGSLQLQWHMPPSHFTGQWVLGIISSRIIPKILFIFHNTETTDINMDSNTLAFPSWSAKSQLVASWPYSILYFRGVYICTSGASWCQSWTRCVLTYKLLKLMCEVKQKASHYMWCWFQTDFINQPVIALT